MSVLYELEILVTHTFLIHVFKYWKERNYGEKHVLIYIHVNVRFCYFKLSFTILYLQKADQDTRSSSGSGCSGGCSGGSSGSVPVLGYYYMPVISSDPNHQLLVFPYTLTHAYFPLPCTLSLSLLRSHSLSASQCKPATTDASHKPLTPNPTHAPIFGAKNEVDQLEMASDDCCIGGPAWISALYFMLANRPVNLSKSKTKYWVQFSIFTSLADLNFLWQNFLRDPQSQVLLMSPAVNIAI